MILKVLVDLLIISDYVIWAFYLQEMVSSGKMMSSINIKIIPLYKIVFSVSITI
jgi:hypothetical protein